MPVPRHLPHLFAAALALAACGGGDGDGDGPDARDAATPTSLPPVGDADVGGTPGPPPAGGPEEVDLCSLLTDDEVAGAIGVPVTSVEPAALSCEKSDGRTRVVVIRHQFPGAGPDSTFENLRLDGAEPVPEITVENLYDSVTEDIRMRTPDGHHLSVQLNVDGRGDRDTLVDLARTAVERFQPPG